MRTLFHCSVNRRSGYSHRSFAPAALALGCALALAACGGGSGAGSTGGGSTGGNSNPTPASITVAPANASAVVGATLQFAATVKDSSGNPIAGTSVTWSASPASVATITAAGLATAVAPGTATITASSGSISGQTTWTVTPPPVASITVAPASPTIKVGATQQFTATAKDANGNTLSGAAITWASSATSVATINASGLATGIAAGSANITAASGGITSAPDGLTVVTPGSVSGTAAKGAALAAATITLKDSAGAVRTATTAADGTFQIDVSGLLPPFLLQTTAANQTLYSVSADTNQNSTINLNPLTDLVVRSYYGGLGTSPDTVFTNPSGQVPPAAAVAVVNGFVQNIVQLWLNNAGVATTNFNLISTPFQANGAGLDKVLDQTTVTVGSGANPTQVAITDGTTTQNSSLSYSPTAGTATVTTTTTTTGGGSSTSTSSTVVPAPGAQTSALAAIQAQTAALTAVLAAKGANLAASDIQPFLASTGNFEGLTLAQFAAELATNARSQASSITVQALTALDTNAGTATGTVLLVLGQSRLTTSMNFAQVNGTWLLAGDGRVAEVDVESSFSVQQTATAATGLNTLNIGVKAPVGLVTAATVTGGGLFNNTALTQQSQQVQTFAPTPGTTLTVTRDNFNANDGGQLKTLIPAGTPFTINLATTQGNVSYVLPSNANTTEGVQFTNLPGTGLSSLTLGGSNTFSWTLPKTFAVASIDVHADAFNGPVNGANSTDCRVELVTNPTATSATLTLPATCQGTILAVQVTVDMQGANGESSQVFVDFQ